MADTDGGSGRGRKRKPRDALNEKEEAIMYQGLVLLGWEERKL